MLCGDNPMSALVGDLYPERRAAHFNYGHRLLWSALYKEQKEASYLKSCQQLSVYCSCIQSSMVFIKNLFEKTDFAMLLKQIFTIERTMRWIWEIGNALENCWKSMLSFSEKTMKKEKAERSLGSPVRFVMYLHVSVWLTQHTVFPVEYVHMFSCTRVADTYCVGKWATATQCVSSGTL